MIEKGTIEEHLTNVSFMTKQDIKDTIRDYDNIIVKTVEGKQKFIKLMEEL